MKQQYKHISIKLTFSFAFPVNQTDPQNVLLLQGAIRSTALKSSAGEDPAPEPLGSKCQGLHS